MSGLMGDILSSANSLTNQSSRLSVIGTNISNVNSDTYSRKSVETVSYSGPGGVVYTDSTVVSSRDGIMDRQVVEETSTSGALSEKVSMYDDLNDVMSESLNGSVGATLATAESTGSGITGGLSSFFNAWSSYAASPNSSSAQGEVYSTAEELVSRLNSASDALDEVQSDLDASLEADVEEANTLLSKIATLNTEIISMEARDAGSSATLVDERQAALEDLAELVDFDYTTEDNGSVTITLASGDSTNGQTLVSNGTAGTISITTDASTGEYTGLAANYGTTSEAFTPSGGSLSVLNPTVTRAAVEELRTQLDTVAKAIAQAVNEVYSATNTTGTAAFFNGTATELKASVVTALGYAASATSDGVTYDTDTTTAAANIQTAIDESLVEANALEGLDGTFSLDANGAYVYSGTATDDTTSVLVALNAMQSLETAVSTGASVDSTQTTLAAAASALSSFGVTAGNLSLAVASKTEIKAKTTTELSGGNSVATAVAAIADTEYSTASGDLVNGTISESAAEVATSVAEKLNNVSDASDNQDEVLNSVTTTRDNVSGVSTDEEMSDLIRTQHAYQACARVLSTIDTLLELVTTRLGA